MSRKFAALSVFAILSLAGCVQQGSNNLPLVTRQPLQYTQVNPAGAPIGYVKAEVYTQPATPGYCVIMMNLTNATNYEIQLDMLRALVRDKYGNPTQLFFAGGGPLVPGGVATIYQGGNAVRCDISAFAITPGPSNSWPGTCVVNRAPATPCPIGLQYGSRVLPIQP